MNRKSVTETLRQEITSGIWSPNDRIPSERILATRFGVSRGTIQGAIRDLETEGYLARERNCCPVVASSIPGQSRPNSVADQVAVWLMTDRQDLGGTMILHGIQATLGVEGYRLLLGCATSCNEDAHQAEIRFLESLIGNPRIAGAILWHDGNPDVAPTYAKLVEAGIPLVFVDREPPAMIEADLVAINGRRGARNLVRHLSDLGHSRIALVIGGEKVSSVQDRIEGYRTGMRETNGSPGDELVIELTEPSMNPVETACELLRTVLLKPFPPTALIAVNDRIALTLLDAAKKLHVEVPARLSIAGFDWLMRWLPNGGDLTTVAQPFHEIGASAAQRLLSRVSSLSAEPAAHILLDGAVIVRDSTGASAAKLLQSPSLAPS